MGVYVRLDVLPEAIDPDAWRDFYLEARELLTTHPDRLVTLRRERIGNLERWVYSRRIEDVDDEPSPCCLRVCGDLASLKTAETFVLPATLPVDRSSYRSDASDEAGSDILSLVLDGVGAHTMFGDKTQGYPYHRTILGVAMLAEARFPHAALAGGDITAAQCEEAARDIEQRLGLRVPIPVLVDAERLYARVVGVDVSVATLERYFRA